MGGAPSFLIYRQQKRRFETNRLFGFWILLLETETTVEAINTSAGVNQFLLASVERMALGANFNVDLRLGGMGVDDLAASAGDGAVHIIGMDALFHSFHLFLVND